MSPALVALVVAGGLVAAATVAVFLWSERTAGVLAALAGCSLLWGGALATRRRDPLLLFLDSVVDRAFDGCLLSAIALQLRDSDTVAAAAAAIALVVSFVAAYERARGQSLGYPVEDSLVTRTARYGLVALGLLIPELLSATMFALAALMALAAAVRASQVAKQERE